MHMLLTCCRLESISNWYWQQASQRGMCWFAQDWNTTNEVQFEEALLQWCTSRQS